MQGAGRHGQLVRDASLASADLSGRRGGLTLPAWVLRSLASGDAQLSVGQQGQLSVAAGPKRA